MQVRPAGPDDASAVRDIMQTVYLGDGWAHPDRSPEYVREVQDVRGRMEQATLFIALDPHPVGTITAAWPPSPLAHIALPGEVELRMLAVVPQARRQGVARALVRACEDLGRLLSADRMVLSTEPGMTGAHRLYDALGYRRSPDRDWKIADSELLAYCRDLTRPGRR